MSTMVILGAGASRACPNTNPNLPMPLLRDLPGIFSHADPQTSWPRFGVCLNRLLESTDQDIEVLFTLLQRLQDSFFFPRRQNGLDATFIDEILSSSLIPEVFSAEQDARQAGEVLSLLRTFAIDQPEMVVMFSPLNFFTMFRLMLRQYCQASFIRYPCPHHLSLFQNLGRGDAVVSFNYDEIADYSLYSAGKLKFKSFEGLGFAELFLPTRDLRVDRISGMIEGPDFRTTLNEIDYVTFLKLHGSFNWFCRAEETGFPREDWTYSAGDVMRLRHNPKGGPEVRYCLGGPEEAPDWSGWTEGPLIFPLLTKSLLYRANAMFARHITAFQYQLRDAKDIFLVGKNFRNSDRELNGLIKWASHGVPDRRLHIIDPNSDQSFGDFHCDLFNATPGDRFYSFEEYGLSRGSSTP